MSDIDSWKDRLLERQSIPIEEFNSSPEEVKLWILKNKHVFYNAQSFLVNLLHRDSKPTLDSLRKSNKLVRIYELDNSKN